MSSTWVHKSDCVLRWGLRCSSRLSSVRAGFDWPLSHPLSHGSLGACAVSWSHLPPPPCFRIRVPFPCLQSKAERTSQPYERTAQAAEAQAWAETMKTKSRWNRPGLDVGQVSVFESWFKPSKQESSAVKSDTPFNP